MEAINDPQHEDNTLHMKAIKNDENINEQFGEVVRERGCGRETEKDRERQRERERERETERERENNSCERVRFED